MLTAHPDTRAPLRRALAILGLIMALMVHSPALAQDPAAQAVDYAQWEKDATAAEKEIAQTGTAADALEQLRAGLVTWRNALSTAQTANGDRIATVREQIAALGPVPADGATEAPEIAAKRAELNDQLSKLQAPGIAAEEAYRRADGLIREIDRELRERQADQLLQLWPSPLNPANWPEAASGLTDTVTRVVDETAAAWDNERARGNFFDNLPLIGLLLLVAGATTIFARRWIERFADRLQDGGSQARQRIFALIASLGQVIVPVIGMIALSVALMRTGLLGRTGGGIAGVLPFIGFTLFIAIWLGAQTFPRRQSENALLPLPPERRTEGRFHAAMMGLVIAIEILREVTMAPQGYPDAVTGVASFPILVAGGLLLWRMGKLLSLSRDAVTEGDGSNYLMTLLSLLARALTIIGILGPLLAALGYVQAGKAMVYPAILTLGLLAFLLVLQRLLADVWAIISRVSGPAEREGLVPVLIGFLLFLISLPMLALIWGARLADLTELWTRFREGFQMGDTRISPTDFLLFAVVFSIGFMVTRLFQGALRNTILPRTQMERGGQNALVSGTGYVGIFLAALLAINATGIDLSGLAIVASALSVGIGFGLQNIVQNFVSGIILMIERPVSEGDWIEVGTTQGIVKTISVRSTRIQTFDRSVVVVPNADLVSQRVTNWTRFGLTGRVIVPVSVAWGEDTRRVETLLREIAEAQPMVILNPAPAVLFQSFSGGMLNFEIRAILRDVNFSGQVKNDINHAIVARFIAEGIAMPATSAEITLGNPEDLSRAFLPPMAQPPRAEATPDDRRPPPPTDPATEDTR